MAQSKMKQLEGENKRSVAQRARRARELAAISRMADENLAATDEWRTLRPEHLAAIKYRLLGGDTLGNVCRELGLERAVVCNYIYENPEFANEVLSYKSFGAHALYERLIDMIDDKSMNAGDKMFAFKVINAYAPKINREVYGDRLDVNATQTVQVSMPDWMLGSMGKPVEGQLIGDPDALEGRLSGPSGGTPKPD